MRKYVVVIALLMMIGAYGAFKANTEKTDQVASVNQTLKDSGGSQSVSGGKDDGSVPQQQPGGKDDGKVPPPAPPAVVITPPPTPPPAYVPPVQAPPPAPPITKVNLPPVQAPPIPQVSIPPMPKISIPPMPRISIPPMPQIPQQTMNFRPLSAPGGANPSQIQDAIHRFVADPLVIHDKGKDLSNRLTDEYIMFDINMDGKMELMPFVTKGSGFLAIDKNKDGVINDGSELFGPATNDGFKELRVYDKNKDGVIDSKDKVYSELLVWGKDKLEKLKDKKIKSINVSNVTYYDENNLTITSSKGNDRGYVASKSTSMGNDGLESLVEDFMLKVMN